MKFDDNFEINFYIGDELVGEIKASNNNCFETDWGYVEKKRTKEEILTLIDAALAGKDKQWFQELTDELKGME